jgi:diguanylate cyclase (GGDEF)-like protein
MDFNTAAWLNIAFGLGVLFAGFILFETSRAFPESLPGGKTWAVGNFLMFLGLTILGLRSFLPEFIPVLIGNGILIGATFLFFEAFNKVLEKNESIKFGLVILACTEIGLAYFLFIQPDYSSRVLIFSLGIIATSAMSFKLLFPELNSEQRIIPRIIIIIYIITIVMFIDRVIVVVFNRDQEMAFFDQNPHILISLVLLSAIVIVLTFAFVLLSNTNNYLKIHKLAYLDELTQAFSRRAILDHGRASINLSNRSQIPFSVLLIDLDNLKQINDQYGHIAGDQALKTVARIIRQNLREEDVIGRYGGDEFVVILRDTNLKGAENTTKRLIIELESADMSNDQPLSVSIGICQYNPNDYSFEEILHRADQALYVAKEVPGISYQIMAE